MNMLRTNSSRFTWLAVGLALFTALTYILIASNIFSVGNPQVARDGGAIIYVAAGCYLFGGLLILLRNRWLLLFRRVHQLYRHSVFLQHVSDPPRSACSRPAELPPSLPRSCWKSRSCSCLSQIGNARNKFTPRRIP
jgi:hypothetical protein